MSDQKKEPQNELDEGFWVKQARIGHLAAPKNDPQFKKDADRISRKLGTKK